MAPDVILPGSTIGMLGGGQLGRMFALAAHQLGYQVIGYTPEADSPLSQVCRETFVASFDDQAALAEFARRASVITIEFENIPLNCLETLSRHAPVRPRPEVLSITQNRLKEKTFLSDNSFPVAPFQAIRSGQELPEAIDRLSLPAVLKTASFGYDGKGQRIIRRRDEALAAWSSLGGGEAILEKFIPFQKEISAIGVRGLHGDFASFGPIENGHVNHILDVSFVPARLTRAQAEEAGELARAIMVKIDAIGLMCVEMFVGPDGGILVNELAPRPHNSGHYSIEACASSQFEAHVRAITGLPLGSTAAAGAAAMANLLGEIWQGGEPNWQAALSVPGSHLHLYGKKEARTGRKMGHITCLDKDSQKAVELALAAREALRQ